MTESNLPARAAANGAGDALPGLVRLAATSWLRTAEWSLVAGLRTSRKALEAATNPQSARELAQGIATASGVVADLAKAVSSGVSLPQAVIQVSASLGGASGQRASAAESESRALEAQRSLRDQGEQLLRKSRDVWNNDMGHPAYERILSELAPDEARILLLLLRGGPQPSVDVRTGGAIGVVSSRLVAPGLTMIGPRAGLRYLDQVPAYLNNLFRLGQIWFSREQLRDPHEYQVVEAQPDVLRAMLSVRAP